jgi:hypothetical protein
MRLSVINIILSIIFGIIIVLIGWLLRNKEGNLRDNYLYGFAYFAYYFLTLSLVIGLMFMMFSVYCLLTNRDFIHSAAIGAVGTVFSYFARRFARGWIEAERDRRR